MLWTLIVMLFLIFKKKIVKDLLFELVAFKFLLKIKTMIGILLFEKI